jgi:signal transduction histidine kinase
MFCRVGTMLDLTAERHSQEALRQSESSFRLAVVASGIHFFSQDRDLRYTWVVRGDHPEGNGDFLGKCDHDFMTREDADRLLTLKRRILATGEGERLEMDISIFGEPKSFDVTYEPVRDASGQIVGLVGAAVDITERRRTEAELRRAAEQLQQAHKLEALGTLAGGVAHDFGNLLSAISAHLALARAHGPLPAAALESLNAVEEAARQASGVARSLLTLSRGDDAPRAPVHLAAVVENVERLMRRTLPRNIVMLVDHALEREPWVMGDETQLSQVLLNLMLNARDAMPEGGILRIRLGGHDDPCALSDQTPCPCAGIDVEDSGVGMPPEVIDRARDPFFSTKPRGKGSGLGLAVANAIIQAHGGVLDIDSVPGRGTRVRILLPAIPPPEPAAAHPAPDRQRRSAMILEDNRLTRGLVSSMLLSLGFDVAPPDADAAIASRAPDLLVFKVGAAVPTHEVEATIRRVKPLGTILLVPRGSLRHDLSSSAAITLSMPFQQADLASCIEGLLSSTAQIQDPACAQAAPEAIS